MKRKIITIDRERCNGCGRCVSACHEGAIAMVEGKARLMREDYCDGLGDCLPACPTGAIAFEEREALAYDQQAAAKQADPLPCGCPGSNAKRIERRHSALARPMPGAAEESESQLQQWPVQIKLVPLQAPYFDDAKLLVAADCAAYAYGRFHRDFIQDHIVLIGCPKLDGGDYAEKLTAILQNNAIKSVRVVRMEVPCCAGLEQAVIRALQGCGKMIPWQSVTLSTDGSIVD